MIEALLMVAAGLVWGFVAIAGAVYGLAAMFDAASRSARSAGETGEQE